MKEIIVNGLDDSAVERLKKRAAAHGRSLEEEVRHLLTCGLDALEYAQTAFKSLKEKGEAVASMAQGMGGVSEFRRRMQQPIVPDIDDL